MQFKFVILFLALVASTMAFPIMDNEEKGMFGGDEGREGMEFLKNLLPAAKEGLIAIHNNTDLTRGAEEAAVVALFNNGENITPEDKTSFANLQVLAAKKENEFTSAIDKAVADSSLTDAQKALYTACKEIYSNKNLTIQQTKQNIEAAIAAADKTNPGDSEAVKSLVMNTIHSQIKADKAASA
uniref:DUF148 domain-containing protein n=1 Tax=Rhabditophanes sp. KR3021 TaxID=114890 RepID=A0AC35U267_9BILA